MSENTQIPEQSQPLVELTIVDLQNIRSIIDVASRRGTFGAAEMAAVGGVFNKLNAFLDEVAPQQSTDAPTTTEAPTTTKAPTEAPVEAAPVEAAPVEAAPVEASAKVANRASTKK